jgi:hypothetical protein
MGRYGPSTGSGSPVAPCIESQSPSPRERLCLMSQVLNKDSIRRWVGKQQTGCPGCPMAYSKHVALNLTLETSNMYQL